MFFLGTAALTGGCWEAGLTQSSESLAGNHLPPGFSWGMEGQGGEPEPKAGRPAPRLARRLAGAHWVGPSSGSLFAVTVLGAGLSDTNRAH